MLYKTRSCWESSDTIFAPSIARGPITPVSHKDDHTVVDVASSFEESVLPLGTQELPNRIERLLWKRGSVLFRSTLRALRTFAFPKMVWW